MFSEEDINEALEFLRVAKRDLEAAKLLIDSELYSQGLFLLQQSIEKTAKAILRGLGIANANILREKVGHKIFVKGLKVLALRLDDMLKDLFTETFVKNLRNYVFSFSLCQGALNEFEKILKLTREQRDLIRQWTKREYNRILNLAKEISSIALEKTDQDSIHRINKFIDELTEYVLEPGLLFEEPKMMEIVNALKSMCVEFRKCISKQARQIKSREQRVRLKKVISKLIKEINEDVKVKMHELLRAIYLLDVFLLVLVYHTIFEENISKLRYPNKNWSPLNISGDTIIVDEAKKIIDFIDKQKLIDTLMDFIKGEITSEKSRIIYEKLTNYLLITY